MILLSWGCGSGSSPGTSGQFAYVTDDQRDVVSVLDTTTNTVTNTMPVGPGIRPCGIALSPDGGTAYVANPSPDTVSVIDLATLTASSVYLNCTAGACSPNGVIVSPDGRFVYAVSEGLGHLAVTEIDVGTRAPTRTFRVNGVGVSGGCSVETISPDGRLLYVRLVVESGFAFSVIDTVTGSELTRLDDPPLSDMVFLPSGNALAAVTTGGVAIVDAASQQIERVIPIDGDLGSIAVSPDSSTAYLPDDCTVVVVDLAAGAVKTTIPLDQSCSLWDLTVTPDGNLLLIADLTGPSIIEIDTSSNVLKKTLPLAQGIGSLAASPDSTTLYVVNGTPGVDFGDRSAEPVGALLRVDLQSNAVTSFFPPAGPSALASTSTGEQLYVANSLSDEVVVLDTRSHRVEARIPVASPASVAVDAGNRIFVGSSGYYFGSVTAIDRIAMEVVATLPLSGPVVALVVAPDGNRLYAGTGVWPDGAAINVIDTETLTPLATIPVDKSITALAFAPDGHQLYAAESQYAFNEVTGGVALIDAAAESVQNVIATGGVPGLGVSPDGRTVYAPTGFCCLGEHSPELSVIDTVSQSIRATRPIDSAGRIAITSAGEAVYVISGWSPGRVTVIDTSTLGTLATVNVGVSPSHLVIARKPADHRCAGNCAGDAM